MRERGRRWAVLVLAAVSVVAALRPSSAQEEAPFAGAAEVRAGDTVRAVMGGFPGEVHQFTFFARAGSRVSARLATAAGSSLLADVRLTRPGGTVLATGHRLSLRDVRRSALDAYEFPYSGNFVLEVVRRAGTGGYTLATKAQRSGRFGGLDPAPGASGTWRFDAPGGSLVRVVVRAPGSAGGGEGPRITGLTDPGGDAVPIVATTRGRKATTNDVVLVSSGTYELAWQNPGGARRLRFAFLLRPLNDPSGPRQFGVPEGIAAGAPEAFGSTLAARDGYVGSAACGRCHDDLYTEWLGTAHRLATREWQRAGLSGLPVTNDRNANGRDDFRDGLDLRTTPNFAAYGTNAPKLSYVAGDARPYKATIAGVTYDIERTAGGNGLHEQSYLARIGDGLYPLPFEWDEVRREYAAFGADLWYAGTAPRFASTAAVTPDVSYAVRCAGCHATGVVVESQASGAVLDGWVESGVGCESCHGPGAKHAGAGDPSLIANPADLLDGSAAGVAAANDTCVRCHDRGTAVDAVAGTSLVPKFGYTAEGGVVQAGDDPDAFRTRSTDPADFWGYKAAPVSGVSGAGYVAARARYMQGREIDAGPHAAVSGDAPACIDCHAPHARRQEGMLRTVVSDDGVRVRTRLPDNTLCLSCHAGEGPFANVTKTDVLAVPTTGASASIVTAVVTHMRDMGMGVGTFLYDPEGTGVGRCDTCHMPRTAAAVFGTDAAGHMLGNRASHEFRVVWPRASVLHGVTNSCSTCHPTGSDDRAAVKIAEWSVDGPDGDGTFHADTPRSFQNGVRNPDDDGGLPCVQCHTTEGFLRVQVRGEALTQDDRNAILLDAVGHDEGITCRACHGMTGDGEFLPGSNPVRFPKAELCGRCHNNESLTFGDFRDDGELPRHPQREMLLGTAGAQVPGSGAYGTSAHSLPGLFPDNCVNCHFDHQANGAPKHDFEPRVETCRECHSGLTSFDRIAVGDYDGSGTIEGIQSEVRGLLDVLRDALLLDASVSFSNGRFNYGGATDGRMTGASEAQKRAVFNYTAVNGDGSLGIHNAVLAVQLLQRSYAELTGAPVPGADLR